jgi:cyclic pyranopterin phosphate synthase
VSSGRKPADAEGLTHVDASGTARMVDVTAKPVTRRRAIAEGRIRMAPETARAIRAGDAPKGDVLGTARLAGIMGGKRAAELIPLCHPLPGTTVTVELEVDDSLPGVTARAEAVVEASTGVEMEALTAVSVALLTVYDMAKALDRGMVIEGIRLLRKEGGRSGVYQAPDQP